MRRVGGAIDARREALTDALALDQGKPRRAEAFDEVEDLIAYFEMAAADATRMGGLRFAEAVRTGWVNVNEGTNYWESHLPFGGGAGSRSGVGRVGGRSSMDRLTELKTIVIDLA
jgi:acyl-CoA reductase-like NAD-dependent aldehyde dehydrogenase